MLVMIVIDCIGSHESNYDIITTTTVASEIVNNLDHVHVSSTNKTDGYDITETLLTVVLNTITSNPRILDIMKLEHCIGSYESNYDIITTTTYGRLRNSE
jgi:hypothetical protein